MANHERHRVPHLHVLVIQAEPHQTARARHQPPDCRCLSVALVAGSDLPLRAAIDDARVGRVCSRNQRLVQRLGVRHEVQDELVTLDRLLHHILVNPLPAQADIRCRHVRSDGVQRIEVVVLTDQSHGVMRDLCFLCCAVVVCLQHVRSGVRRVCSRESSRTSAG